MQKARKKKRPQERGKNEGPLHGCNRSLAPSPGPLYLRPVPLSSAAPAGVTLASIRDAAAGLAGVAIRTPLVEAPALSRVAGVPVRLKCEHLQPVGAFKLRGAYTAISRLTDAERHQGVATHSSGNHGLALAWAARRLGVAAVVVMPEDAPQVKIQGVRQQGAEIVFVADRSQREPVFEALVRERGMIPIPPFEHPDVIAGQGTCGLEILEQWPEASAILVPTGGGGLLAGVATAVSEVRPEATVVGVEPANVRKLSAALAAGRSQRTHVGSSLADGLLTPAIGSIPFAAIHGRVREVVQVSDDDLRKAVRFLFESMGLRVEPSGAAAAAALLARNWVPSSPSVAILTGGNVDPELFWRLVA
jgi:threonine dehydratase